MVEPRSSPSPSPRSKAGDFLHFPLGPGLDFYMAPTSRFKTFTVQAVLHGELGPDTTAFALLPMILRRGTRNLPTMQDLTRFLDDLYGTSLDVSLLKRGEQHMMLSRLSLPGPAFIPDGRETLRRACRFLAELFSSPRLEGNAFPADVTAQEKANLGRQILSLADYRDAYATVRLTREMCAGERYAEYESGNLEALETITPRSLHAFWDRTIRTRPVSLYAVGDADPDEMAALLADAFGWDRGEIHAPGETERKRAPEAPRRIEERFPLRQEWVVQGYRMHGETTGAEIPTLIYFNGLFGGFPTSKLFKRIREAEGLAYEIFSHVDPLKGVLFVVAGVQPKKADRVLDGIAEALRSLQRGEITPEEMTGARNRIVGEVRALPDSPNLMIHAAQEGLLQGNLRTAAEMEKDMARVTAQDVCRMAEGVHLDTTFLLLPEDGEDKGT